MINYWFIEAYPGALCECEASHSIGVVHFLHGNDISCCSDVQSKVIFSRATHDLLKWIEAKESVDLSCLEVFCSWLNSQRNPEPFNLLFDEENKK